MTDEATTEPADQVGDVQPNAEPEAPAEEPTAKNPENAEAAKHRIERNKARDERDAALAQLAEVQAQLEELSKRAEKGDQLEGELGSLRGQIMRMEAAREAGLPREFESRLTGETAEDLLADAKQLASFLKPAEPVRDDLDAGPRGQAPKTLTVAEQIAQLEAEGKYQEAAPLKAALATQYVAGS